MPNFVDELEADWMSNPIPTTQMSADDINQTHAAFWNQQSARDNLALGDPIVAKVAFESLRSEWMRGVPVRCQLSYSAALNNATKLRDDITKIAASAALTGLSRKGGFAEKRDALGDLICTIVEARPFLSERDLLDYLDSQRGLGVVQDIESGVIYFTQHDGNTKTAHVSGLKDRLSRAKKKTYSR